MQREQRDSTGKVVVPARTIRDLVKASLRDNPDRIIIGEVRGAEAFDLLDSANTGHTGSISTLHANSALEALSVRNDGGICGCEFVAPGHASADRKLYPLDRTY